MVSGSERDDGLGFRPNLGLTGLGTGDIDANSFLKGMSRDEHRIASGKERIRSETEGGGNMIQQGDGTFAKRLAAGHCPRCQTMPPVDVHGHLQVFVPLGY